MTLDNEVRQQRKSFLSCVIVLAFKFATANVERSEMKEGEIKGKGNNQVEEKNRNLF